jgi:hypothetical protein
MIDLSKQIYDYLSGQGAVTALTGGRIWPDANFPPKSYAPDQGAALTFRPRGGFCDYTTKVWRISYQFKHYGETDNASSAPASSAFALYAAVYSVLNEAVFSSVRYTWYEVPMQTYTENVPTPWPFYLAYVAFEALDDA